MTADERINALLNRAGCPVMKVRGEQENRQYINTAMDGAMKTYGGMPDILAMTYYAADLLREKQELVSLVDRLEVALENVLNEREGKETAHENA